MATPSAVNGVKVNDVTASALSPRLSEGKPWRRNAASAPTRPATRICGVIAGTMEPAQLKSSSQADGCGLTIIRAGCVQYVAAQAAALPCCRAPPPPDPATLPTLGAIEAGAGELEAEQVRDGGDEEDDVAQRVSVPPSPSCAAAQRGRVASRFQGWWVTRAGIH